MLSGTFPGTRAVLDVSASCACIMEGFVPMSAGCSSVNIITKPLLVLSSDEECLLGLIPEGDADTQSEGLFSPVWTGEGS